MFVSYEEKEKKTGFINNLGCNIIWIKICISYKFDLIKCTKYLKNGTICTFSLWFYILDALHHPVLGTFYQCGLHAEEQSLMLAKAMPLIIIFNPSKFWEKKNRDPSSMSSQFNEHQIKYSLTF